MLQRVQKILAAAGIASRRKSEHLILEGRVTVNGSIIKLGDKADAEKGIICVDGRQIKPQRKVYVALYKPYGYVTTTSDQFATKKVTDLVEIPSVRLFPVGRLDSDAEGLLILTNDGEFANKLMHPRYEVEKTYLVKLRDKLSREDVEKLRRGISVEGRKVEAKIKLLQKDLVEVAVHEGRHKIVKRLFKALGNYVIRITRISTGIGEHKVSLKGLKPGQWRYLTNEEVSKLLAAASTPQAAIPQSRNPAN